MRYIAAAVLLCLLSSPSIAQDAPESGQLTIKDLADGCEIYSDILEGVADGKYGSENAVEVARQTLKAGVCVGYINGFLSGHSYATRNQPPLFCLPQGVTVPQLARMIVKAARGMPQFEHKPAIAVMIAATVPFPCDSPP